MGNRTARAPAAPHGAMPAVADATAMGEAMAKSWQTLAGLSVPPAAIAKLQSDYVEQASALWNQAISSSAEGATADRRFAGKDWAANPIAAFTAQTYLLNARALMQLAEAAEQGKEPQRAVDFYARVPAASPFKRMAEMQQPVRARRETKDAIL